ncbi:Uncharacterised protein [Mycobacteroides abscessus subsp. abscessus]|uniref:hypothetical protein n=1 Tax=Mycobacteroides abscessus TaxID=36809 RepID=UPI00092B1C0D|nr:hypothetical protein [Mycobacteroides abscessus]SHT26562.1 Uncharacterised protein [Mycobacteroides abscessus subsp. abscessus]
MSNEAGDEMATISKEELKELIDRIDQLESTHRNTSSILGMIAAGLFMGLLFYIAYAQGQFDETTKKTDPISISELSTSDLLKKGEHCFDSSMEAVAAQVRILEAADLDRVDTRLSRLIDQHDKQPSMIPPEGRLAINPTISKVENRDGRVCFTVTHGGYGS